MKEYAIVANNVDDEGIVGFVNSKKDAYAFIGVVTRTSRGTADTKFWFGEVMGANHHNGTIKDGDVITLDFIDGEDVFGSSHKITFEDSFVESNAAFCKLFGCELKSAIILHGWFDNDLGFCGIPSAKGCAIFRFNGDIPRTNEEIFDKCKEIIKKNIVSF